MNRRNLLKTLLAAPFAGMLAPISKLFGESKTSVPVFRAIPGHSLPQRVDTLSLEHWGKVGTPIEFCDVAGQTVFPWVDTDGTVIRYVCMTIHDVQVEQ